MRLVMAEGADPPNLAPLNAGLAAEISQIPPRFEDAFMDLIGGGFRATSPFANREDSAAHTMNQVVEARALTRW